MIGLVTLSAPEDKSGRCLEREEKLAVGNLGLALQNGLLGLIFRKGSCLDK